MELYLSLILFATSASVTPGPNNIMMMTSGLNFGVKKSLPHLFGICVGFPLMIIVVGMGFSVVFQRWPIVHEVIKIVSVFYLLYLAWKIATSAPTNLESEKKNPISFIQAALFQWINPKAWVMATGAISAYTSLSSSFFTQVLIIALVFFVLAFPCVGVWLMGGVGLKRFLQRPNYQRVFNVSMAVLLAASIVPTGVELVELYFG
ncbi:MAG: LysE family translocator [Psychrosphaera sp.]|nr:LysE family translocator [Psychrosphaera sp.]